MTVWESTTYDVAPETLDAFVKLLVDAAEVFGKAEGCYSYAVHRSVITPGRVHLYLEWESVEHHTEIFAGTQDRIELREAIVPYLVGRGEYDHAEQVHRVSFR